MVNMWTRVRHHKELFVVVVQDSHRVKAGLLKLTSTTPFVDIDPYVASSYVSLIGYICTHVFLIYVFAERLQSLSVWNGTYGITTIPLLGKGL